jgi:ferredoxin
VNPNLCVGCGACTTVCPTGALTYAYPGATDQGLKLKTLLSTYTAAGGKDAVLLLHSQERGQAPGGRAGPCGAAQDCPRGAGACDAGGVVAHGQHGVDLWLSAVAFGASQIVVLVTSEEAPQYLDGLEAQMAVAQAILNGLGYTGTHLKLLRARNPTDLDAGLQALSHTRQTVPGGCAFCRGARKAQHAGAGTRPPDCPSPAARGPAARSHCAACGRAHRWAPSRSTKTAARCA